MGEQVAALQEEALARYREATPGSARLHARARQVLPGGDTRNASYLAPHPLYVERGSGAWVEDVDGRCYLDCTTNMSSMLLGHAHPAVVAAATEQVARGTGWAAANRWAVELAELLCERVPGLERVRFTNSGTEAVMMAVRAARASTGRPLVARAAGAYHGAHDEFEVGGGVPQPGLVPGIEGAAVEFEYNDAGSVSRLFAEHGERIAAAIVDPAFMAGGFLPPRPGFLERLREETARHGALLVFDEVVSLRLSLGGAQAHYGVTPDLTALGKTIGGGFPVGAFGGRAEIMERFSPEQPGFLRHSGTFNGNPVTARAGLAALSALDADTMGYLNRLGARLAERAEASAREAGVSLHVTGAGSLRQLHLAPSRPETLAESRAGRRDLVDLLCLRLVSEGVLIASGRMALPAVMTEAEVDDVAGRVGESLAWLRPAVEEAAPELLRA